jgi:phage terminase large subunit-like protein
MKTVRKLMFVLSLLVVLAVLAVPTFAQGRTVTVTEDQINSSFAVTNNPRRRVNDVYVDLQPGQAVISATITVRNGSSWDTVTTLTPSVSSAGRVTWTATSVTVNGQAASQEVITQVNASIASSWRNFVRNQVGSGRVASMVIDDSDIVFTLR